MFNDPLGWPASEFNKRTSAETHQKRSDNEIFQKLIHYKNDISALDNRLPSRCLKDFKKAENSKWSVKIFSFVCQSNVWPTINEKKLSQGRSWISSYLSDFKSARWFERKSWTLKILSSENVYLSLKNQCLNHSDSVSKTVSNQIHLRSLNYQSAWFVWLKNWISSYVTNAGTRCQWQKFVTNINQPNKWILSKTI